MIKLLMTAILFSSVQAFALPVEVTRPIQKLPFKSLTDQNYDFEGIVKLSNCSGALIAFEGMPETNKAVVMTNGHCADLAGGVFIEPGQVLVNKLTGRTIGIFDRLKNLHKVKTTKYLYATMTDTDVTLYELELTYKQIKDQFDIDALELSSKHPALNVETQIISGYWEKGYDCTVEAFIPFLKEDAYTWVDSLRYDKGCNTIHGTSGAPIIERNTRTVIAINNTGSDDGERCTMNNPCEVSANGTVTARKGISYGQQTYTIYSCLNAKFAIDLKKSGCLLPKPQKKTLR
jgi:V8-like Glu-specific endopeptidase